MISKVFETCVYSPDLDSMKKFYAGVLGLLLVQEEEDKLICLKVGKSVLLIFNPDKTGTNNGRQLGGIDNASRVAGGKLI